VSLPMLFVMAFVVALSGALMPGPVLFATVRWSAERGRWTGPLIVVGHGLVEVPLMAALVLGLGETLSARAFAGVVGMAGGAVMALMALQMLRGLPSLKLPPLQGGRPLADPAMARIVALGAVTSISNPYFVLWWATAGLGFMANAAPHGTVGYAVFYVGHILADLAWYWAVSESVHRGRRFLSDAGYRWLVGTCATFLGGFAVYFAWNGYGLLSA